MKRTREKKQPEGKKEDITDLEVAKVHRTESLNLISASNLLRSYYHIKHAITLIGNSKMMVNSREALIG
jgi:hypothetical protein